MEQSQQIKGWEDEMKQFLESNGRSIPSELRILPSPIKHKSIEVREHEFLTTGLDFPTLRT